jgi:hypothetical protein
MKQAFKRITPEPIWNAARETRDAIVRLPEVPAAYFHPWRRHSIEVLNSLRNKHRGERCFIIGNGPSLRQTDMSKLRNEFTFGMNRFYLMFPELGFTTSYFVLVNDLVIEQCRDEILALPVPKFLCWRSRRFFQPDLDPAAHNLSFLYTSYTGPRFSGNASGRIWEGATVTFITLQLAFHMGFSQVILIGVDHNYVTKGEAHKTVTSEGDDPNHFAPNYFGKGFRWQLPDLDTSEQSYSMAKAAYTADRREVLDATVDGKLTIFPKVDYLSLFR